MKKLIICCALNGSLPTKEQNPSVPVTPDEIVADGLAAYRAGASIVHIHARDREGKNCHDPLIFREIHDKLKAQAPELIVQLSTGGRAGQGFESRNACLFSNPEMASLCTGSANFPVGVYANDMELVIQLAQMMKERSIKPEIEVFDTNMVGAALELERMGLIGPPLYFDFVMGGRNGQAADIRQLGYLVSMLPPGAEWCASGIGASQVSTMLMAIGAGGHVRVGLEDNLYLRRGVKASNAELVERVVRIAGEVNREVASPAEAREMLGLPVRRGF